MTTDYTVIACYGRRRQKEANATRLEAQYPHGYWWITAEGHHEFRVPHKEAK